jgi:pyruvate/2-oxoglutarate dehydrogenase complex dihydrolipoamide acyltransferase (E2) component
MAVPITVPRLGPGDGEALIAEWYQADGATVAPGDLVYRIETDYAAIDVEADAGGIVRHARTSGQASPFGEVIAYILSPGETLPGEPAPKPAKVAKSRTVLPPPPPAVPEPASEAEILPVVAVADAPEEREASESPPQAAHPQAEVAPATVDLGNAPVPESPPAVARESLPAPAADAASERVQPPKPLLLFPRIVNELMEEAAVAGPGEVEEIDLPPVLDEPPPDDGGPVSAWELVPGENDFNPDWLLEPAERGQLSPPPPARDRFQASSIRSLALGRGRSRTGERADEPLSEGAGHDEPEPRESGSIAPADSDLVVDEVEERKEQRGASTSGAPLFIRVAIDVSEATKMREQLTREWWGSNIRPTDQDVVLRAIARALHESAAFRRRTDVVGLRPLAGSSRTVHLLADAATRPFRDAVASLAALRATPGADMGCLCTLTDFGEFELDDAVPALPAGQPLAFAMGVVRDAVRFDGETVRRASQIVLTLSYDPDAMPEGAAARLLARVRELVEAPYALLAD